MPTPGHDHISLTKLILNTLIFLYSLAHLVLLLVSSLAWTSARRFVHSEECLDDGREYCGFTRWGLYFFISVAALICFVTTAGMSFNGLFRTSVRHTSTGMDHILRGVLLTLAVLAPLVYLGWQDVTVVSPEPVEANMNFTGNATGGGNANSTRSFEGLSGVFILEIMDKSSPLTHAAFTLIHFNLAFGAMLAGIAAAMSSSPPAPVDNGPATSIAPNIHGDHAARHDKRREPTMHEPAMQTV